MAKLIHYLKEVRAEVKKVNWPTRAQTMRYTLAVIGLSLVLAVFFGALDYGFSYLVETFVI
jgi:preprotein translocase subunit SecE